MQQPEYNLLTVLHRLNIELNPRVPNIPKCCGCRQYTDDPRMKWGCLGNPDNNDNGCPHFFL